MAGTLPGIPLSQQFSAIGKPLAGCLLYIYAANTTTPQDSFLDQGLTIKNPWPLAGDNSGRVPMFYLVDGSVHVRLTDSSGVVQFDYPSMLVIGPSSGGGGTPPSVDPTTIFQTGDLIWLDVAGARTGWVRDNGRTIGNAVSGASERANADTQALFVFLWNTYPDGICAVSGGRGANGLADFTAGKPIRLPDKRGFSPIGDAAMGNSDSLRLGAVPILFGSPTSVGSWLGEPTHTLSVPEMPSHTHTDTGHTHPLTLASLIAGGSQVTQTVAPFLTSQSGNTGTGSANIQSTGGGSPHNITGLVVVGSFFRKL